MKRIIRIIQIFSVLLAASLATGQDAKQLPVFSIQSNNRVPLTQALRIVGLHLRGGFVSFGVDISEEAEPEVDVNMPDTILGDALQRITSQIPGYSSEFISDHVVEIYSTKERSNSNDPLNLPVREFSVKNVPAFMILAQPTRYLPELKAYLSKDHKGDSGARCGSLSPGLGSYALGVTVSLTGPTVRNILDAVAEADADLPLIQDSPHSNPPRYRMPPSGRIHTRKSDPKLGVVDAWSSMSFVSHDWKQYVAK